MPSFIVASPSSILRDSRHPPKPGSQASMRRDKGYTILDRPWIGQSTFGPSSIGLRSLRLLAVEVVLDVRLDLLVGEQVVDVFAGKPLEFLAVGGVEEDGRDGADVELLEGFVHLLV